MSKVKVIIYASGEAKRWARTGPGAAIESSIHKQLLPIPCDGGNDTEPLIVRTVGQVLKWGSPVAIITPYDEIITPIQQRWPDSCIAHWIDFLDVGSPPILTETIRASEPVWTDGQMVGLLGDCYYSDYAMKAIMQDRAPVKFYGRKTGSLVTGNAAAEVFAWRWHGSDKSIMAVLDAAKLQADQDLETRDKAGTPYGGLWQLYRGMVDIPLTEMGFPHSWQEIYDFTDDFDTPTNYKMWLERYLRRTICQAPIKVVEVERDGKYTITRGSSQALEG